MLKFIILSYYVCIIIGAEANRMEEREMIVDDFQRSRLIITRSDSFHSIGQQRKNISNDDNNLMKRVTNVNALPQRSTSFLSLRAEIAANNASKNTKVNAVPYSKQKSTSELSISDVPSLQSLEVIKNILNSSRKNSLQDPQGEVDATVTQITTTQVTVAEVKKLLDEPKVESPPPPKVIEEKKKEVIRQLESQMSEPSQLREVKKPSADSQWRYSGPPKINFSTWSERPKVEVAVMNDGDYIFGGQNSTTTLPRDFKNSVTIEPSSSVLKRAEIFSSKVTTTPVTVNAEKPKPPKVLNVEYKKDVVSKN